MADDSDSGSYEHTGRIRGSNHQVDYAEGKGVTDTELQGVQPHQLPPSAQAGALSHAWNPGWFVLLR